MLINSGLFAPTPAKADSTEETYVWTLTTPVGLRAIAYGNNLYVGAGLNGLIYTSPDLVTWMQQDVSAQTNKRLNTVKFLNGKFHAATGRDDNRTGAFFIYSSDGTNWSAGTGSTDYNTYVFSSIAYANNKYLATSSNGGGIEQSSTGASWSNTTVGVGAPRYNDITYVSNRFLVVGNINTVVGNINTVVGVVRQSADNTGTTWESDVSLTNVSGLNGIASDGNQVIAVGDGGTIFRTDATSPLLPTVAVTSPVNSTLEKVAYDSGNGGLYVAVGRSGAIITSSDGINWKIEAATPKIGEYMRGVIFGENTFVAVADGGVYKRVLGRSVSFDSKGGTTVGSQVVPIDTKANQPQVPIRTGYTFAGWYTDTETTSPFDFESTTITTDFTLYAKWTLLLPLSAPANVTAIVGDQQAMISWSSVTGATYYNIYQGTASNTYSLTPVATVSGTTYNYNAINLTNGTTYYFAIKAGSTVTSSTYSNEVVVTPEAVVLPTLPAVNVSSDNPHSELAKAGDTVTLTFTANKDLNGLPTVVIAGHSADVVSVGSSVYTAKYTFRGIETEGVVAFTIDYADRDGNAGGTVSATTDGSSVILDNVPPSGTFLIDGGASSTATTAVALSVTSTDGNGSGDIQMRFSNDNVDWSAWEAVAATKAWTLTGGSGTKTVYMALKDKAGNVTTQVISAAIELRTTSSGSSGSSSSGGNSSQIDFITANVENAGNANKTVVSTVIIRRTTDAKGQKKDDFNFTTEQVAKLVEQLAAAGSSSARIVIPDTKDEVSELNVTFPQASADLLGKNGIGFELATSDVRIDIPSVSMQGLKEDIYFRVVPVKEEEKRKETEQRARAEQKVQLGTGSKSADVIGRPMIIETNLQNRLVTLVLPLSEVSLTKQQLDDLGVFIEHSDGSKEFVKGEIVTYDESGKLGIRFVINKFSTFTIVYMENWNKVATADTTSHKAFVTGYTDGLFKPDARITRAEMATIATRVLDMEMKATSISFTDVPAAHWAKDAIDRVTKMGLMEGYPDGSFKPEQTITRAEMASMVVRMKGDIAANFNGSMFSDVDGHWAKKAIVSSKAVGIINGYPDGTFRPAAELSRAEAITMISKLLERGPLSGVNPKWTDVPATHWAFGYIQEASVNHAAGKTTDDGEQGVQIP
ncbi:hypothetical protein EJP82_25415 [Paenibacillus anaericanus]|uniref:Fibronectin type-III domain-containing protein n=1 Tax=Paenibacillus anaericanus TaxID=170367 RepID=A0A433XYX4_9BACL|nr:hypothetical protein EJP82_25415 [Paenibacillus anaericanus]